MVDGTTGILVRPAARPCSRSGSVQLLAHPMMLEAFSFAATDRARSRYS